MNINKKNDIREFFVYRYNKKIASFPKMQSFKLNVSECSGVMLLDALLTLREKDPTLSFRRSCGEGVCGSDAININGKNGLACITSLVNLPKKIVLRPLPAMPVIRDLVVDLSSFYLQYEKVKPYLITTNKVSFSGENLQTKEERDKLDGLYECILCGCCTSSCFSYWWNPDKYLGPAAILQSARFINDSRDVMKAERLSALSDAYSIFRCRGILNCVDVCPKNLNPASVIGNIRREIFKHVL